LIVSCYYNNQMSPSHVLANAGKHRGVHPIRRLRREAGLTAFELAVRAGLAPSSIYAYETGKIKNPGIKPMWQIAKALAPLLSLTPEEVVEEVMRWVASRGGQLE